MLGGEWAGQSARSGLMQPRAAGSWKNCVRVGVLGALSMGLTSVCLQLPVSMWRRCTWAPLAKAMLHLHGAISFMRMGWTKLAYRS